MQKQIAQRTENALKSLPVAIRGSSIRGKGSRGGQFPKNTHASGVEWLISYFVQSGNTNRSNGYDLFHNCLNDHIDGTGDEDRPVRMSTLRSPSQIVWLFDNGKRAAVAQQNNLHTNIHNGGANISFVDGHVARFRNTEYWDFKTDKGRTNNPALMWNP